MWKREWKRSKTRPRSSDPRAPGLVGGRRVPAHAEKKAARAKKRRPHTPSEPRARQRVINWKPVTNFPLCCLPDKRRAPRHRIVSSPPSSSPLPLPIPDKSNPKSSHLPPSPRRGRTERSDAASLPAFLPPASSSSRGHRSRRRWLGQARPSHAGESPRPPLPLFFSRLAGSRSSSDPREDSWHAFGSSANGRYASGGWSNDRAVVPNRIQCWGPRESSLDSSEGRIALVARLIRWLGCFVDYGLVAIGCSFHACSFFLLLRFQVCRARSCAMLAGPFCSTREARPASAARFARPSPPCRHQVRTGYLVSLSNCLLLWDWDAAIITSDSLNLCTTN
jgi:hypothetical protein